MALGLERFLERDEDFPAHLGQISVWKYLFWDCTSSFCFFSVFLSYGTWPALQHSICSQLGGNGDGALPTAWEGCMYTNHLPALSVRGYPLAVGDFCSL
jgi:hypothetical protein